MHSVIHEGKVLDFKYKKINIFMYSFFIGDIRIGVISKLNRSWSCCSVKPNQVYPVYGFKTRFDAARFLLRMDGYWKS